VCVFVCMCAHVRVRGCVRVCVRMHVCANSWDTPLLGTGQTPHLCMLSPSLMAMMKSTTAAPSRICTERGGCCCVASASQGALCARLPDHCHRCSTQCGASAVLVIMQSRQCRFKPPHGPTLTSKSSNCFSTSFHSGVPALGGEARWG